MDLRIVFGVGVYCVALICAPFGFGLHRHPLLSAHCRAQGIMRGSRDEIKALDRFFLRAAAVRLVAILVFAWPNVHLLAFFGGLEVVLTVIWAAQHWSYIVRRKARLRRRQAET